MKVKKILSAISVIMWSVLMCISVIAFVTYTEQGAEPLDVFLDKAVLWGFIMVSAVGLLNSGAIAVCIRFFAKEKGLLNKVTYFVSITAKVLFYPSCVFIFTTPNTVSHNVRDAVLILYSIFTVLSVILVIVSCIKKIATSEKIKKQNGGLP